MPLYVNFELMLSTIGNVDFMGTVSHFLGIEFSWVFHPDGHKCFFNTTIISRIFHWFFGYSFYWFVHLYYTLLIRYFNWFSSTSSFIGSCKRSTSTSVSVYWG